MKGSNSVIFYFLSIFSMGVGVGGRGGAGARRNENNSVLVQDKLFRNTISIP